MFVNTESQVLNVPIEDIIPNRFQPRLNFDENALKELASSIKEHGIIQPLVLRRLGEKYEIIAGERRYKASKLAGLTTVPAIITEMDDKKSAEVAIVENVQRRDLSAIEEAKSYKALLDKGYLTQEELAKRMGLSQSAISNKLRLLSLSEVVQNALIEGKISERHARSLLQLENFEDQEKWLNIIINDRLTVKDLDERLKGTKKEETVTGDAPIIANTPNINEIRERAVDIINPFEPPKRRDTIPANTEEAKPIPNKFFNYLEDEVANMNVVDTEPNFNSEPVEEIEMLDFDISTPQPPTEPAPQPEVTPTQEVKDMSVAINLVEKLQNDLTSNNYVVNVTKDDNTNELIYTIKIDK